MGYKRAICIELNDLNEEERIVLGHLTYHSGKLWNQANYLIKHRQAKANYMDLYHKLKDESLHLKSLHSRSAQITLDELARAWRNFFNWKDDPEVRPPKYRRKDKTHRVVTWDKTGFRIKGSKVRLSLSKDLKAYLKEKFNIGMRYLWFDTSIDLSNLDVLNIAIAPYQSYGGVSFSLRIIHQVKEPVPQKANIQPNRLMAIDFGSRNLATVTIEGIGEAWIIDGGGAKSVLRKYAKKEARLKAKRDYLKSKGLSKNGLDRKLHQLCKRRNNFLRDLAHKASRKLVQLVLAYGVKKVIVGNVASGKNQESKMSSVVNQMFHLLPHGRIVNQLRYKLEPFGIEVEEVDESYTSRADSLDEQARAKEGLTGNGRRRKRGLFVSTSGVALNADVNACRNMIREQYLEQGIKWFDQITGLKRATRVYLLSGSKGKSISESPCLGQDFGQGIGVEGVVIRPEGIRPSADSQAATG